MTVDLQGRHLLTLIDFTPQEIDYLLDLAASLKRKKRAGIAGDLLFQKNIALLFDKPSTRTRCAFEVAAHDEGANVTFLTNSHMGHKESIEDTAKVLGRMYDGIQFRGYHHATVATLAEYANVPVWNGLTDRFHPTQVLADLLTLSEQFDKPWQQMKLVYVGDARSNVANSLMIGAAKMGMHFVGLAPQSLWPDQALIDSIQKIADHTQAKVEFDTVIAKAVKNADAVYTDVWVSMGEESSFADRIRLLTPYQVNQQMLEQTDNEAVVFLHCLPAFHDVNTEVGQQIKQQFGLTAMEVTDAVFRGRHSMVFDQAENRLHTIKAVMVATIGKL